jgi:1,4-dihydroxy-6-naphthoate synthase
LKLTLGYSPCPNDCFIFDALVHQKIDTEGLDFEVVLDDVETLNRKAMAAELDITKLSFHAFAYVLDHYILLRAGSALGFNCGPLLISKTTLTDPQKQIKTVAIPGKLTTANFLLTLAFPDLKNKTELLFSDIEDAVLNEMVDAGLIIHENRFTYLKKGLKKVMDLGEYWDTLIHAPIPLGGIFIKRNIDAAIQQKVNRLINKSVAYAFANPQSSMPYVKLHAQAMDETVIRQHIQLYVNNFSLDLGETGMNAVNLLFDKAEESGLFKRKDQQLMID